MLYKTAKSLTGVFAIDGFYCNSFANMKLSQLKGFYFTCSNDWGFCKRGLCPERLRRGSS